MDPVLLASTQRMTPERSRGAISDSGQSYHEEWTLIFGGQDHPVTVSYDGNPKEGEKVSGKRVNEYTIQITMKSNGQIDSISKWSVKGGKTLTVTGKSDGKTIGPMLFVRSK